MKLSFKFKIATISFVTSGALLTVFGLIFFAFVYQSGIDRMDREIRTLAESSLHGARPPEHWQTFEESLKFIYGEGDEALVALRVSIINEEVVFLSENAPPELKALPFPKLPDQPESVEGRSGRPQQKAGSRPAPGQFDGPPGNERPRTAGGFINKLDRDADGRVSREEFDGPPTDFHRFDTDVDGYISKAESPTGMTGGRPVSRPRIRENFIPPEEPEFFTLKTADGNRRVGIFKDPKLAITVAMDMAAFYADINRFRTAFLISVPIGLLLLGISGWHLAGRAMKPVAVIADTAEGITAKGLDKRIPMVGSDIELERLVTVSNNMLDRLEKSYHQAVRFSADAAHEMQTPLTILQGELDNAIQTSVDGSDEQQRYSMLLEELRNLKAVVQKLLLLAHADEGLLNVSLHPTNISELFHNAAEDIEIMAPELKIETRIPQGITIPADTSLLNQAIRNMTSNAAKYSAANGRVVFELKKAKNRVQFTLSNTAPAIPEEDRPVLFKRFHRVEKSRSTPGSGLGLSLAREIARAHRGDLVLEPYENGMVSFTLTLPAR